MKWTEKEAPKVGITTLNLVSGITLWEEMVRDRREFCLTKCQNNKVVNMLRPKCTDRRYLDILLLKRENKKNMPMFCYSQRLKGLSRAFQEGEPLQPDVYIYLDDFWKIIHDKQSTSLRSASDLIRRTIIKSKEVLPMGAMDQLIETNYIRGQIFLLWPKLDLCLVNAQDTTVHSLKMFRSIVECITESFGLEISLNVEESFIELNFLNLKLKDASVVQNELQKSSVFTGFSQSEIWTEIPLPSEFTQNEEEIKVKEVHRIFQTVLDVCETSPTTEASADGSTADTSIELSELKQKVQSPK
ncbi:MAG: hypothetical protein EAX86_07620 [Candidatus Heimdallarchaeota archaeon]|nr:hypothetical protein [Candidatus Heimdallarchaeota archaeon]